MKKVLICVMLALGFLSSQANAHHAWSALYDVNGDVEYEAVVKEIIWRNPHVVMYLSLIHI